MKLAKRRFYTPERVEALMLEAYEIALDRTRGSDQVRMVEYLLDQGFGKATSKVELGPSDTSTATLEQRIELAKVAGGLMSALQQQVTVKTLPGPEVVEGEIIEAPIQSEANAEASDGGVARDDDGSGQAILDSRQD